MERTPGPELTLHQRREQAVSRLCDSFARDELTLEEFERRVDVAQRSQDPAELAALLADLQVRTPAVSTGSAPAPAPAPARPAPPPAPAGERKQQGALLAVMGGVERRGAWRPAASTFVLAVMGGAELDFRDVSLPPGVTDVFVLALMGGAVITVPPDLAVDASGFAIMGGFAHTTPSVTPSPDAPLLRIQGMAFMGGVEIKVRLRGETEKQAKQRLRQERRGR